MSSTPDSAGNQQGGRGSGGRQKSQSQQIKILNENGKEANAGINTNNDRITNTDLEAVNTVLSDTMDTIFRTSPAMLYGISTPILLARSGEAPYKDILSATGASVARHFGDKNSSDAKLTTLRTPEEIQRLQRQHWKRRSAQLKTEAKEHS